MSFTPQQLDALTEIINIGVGRAAGVLNQMINSRVRLNVPHIEILKLSDLEKNLVTVGGETVASVKMNFAGPLSGAASLAFPPDSAHKLVSLLTDEAEDSPDFDSLRMETLNEVGNILINGVMGSIINMCDLQHVTYSFPHYSEGPTKELFANGGDEEEKEDSLILAQTNFSVEEHLIEGKILLLFKLGAFDTLLAAIEDTMS